MNYQKTATVNSWPGPDARPAPPNAAPTGQPHGDAPNPAPDWLPDRAWRQLRLLAGLPAFCGLDAAVAATPEAWRGVHDAADPARAPLPGLFARLEGFRRLCVLR